MNTVPAGEDPASKPFPLVGIGASAGGLKAIQAFFDHTPETPGAAFVVVTHLSADRESHLDELLKSHTHMPACPVEGRVQIEVNHVYVLRPGHDLEVDGRHLTLRERPKDPPMRTTIDRFFESLAEAWGRHAVGIVLSGSGSDGSRGIVRIKEAAGLVMAQAPEEAQYPSMPEHVIETGHVDVIGSASELARRCLFTGPDGDVKDWRPAEETLDKDDRRALQKILMRLRSEMGHEFSGYKRSTILRRIGRRMRLHRIEGLEEYLKRLHEDAEETARLYQDLLIPVTQFFRDPQVYDTLAEQVIPRLTEGKEAGEELRLWAAGCATGEEAYSLAMLLAEAREQRGLGPKVQIFATDVDRQAIEKGRQGRYPKAIVRDVSPERLERFFTKRGDTYRVIKKLRETVLFAAHDMLTDPPFSSVDLISCRNVLIYLDKEGQKRAFERFHFALRPEGVLLLGSSESASAAPELFKTVDQSNRIYRQRPGASRPLRFSTSKNHPLSPPAIGESGETQEAADYSDQHLRLVARRYGPTSILVDEDYHILNLTHGDSPFLKYPEKKPPHSVEDVVTEELRPEVRSGLFRLFKKDTQTVRQPVHIERLDKKREVLLTIRPVDFGENFAQIVLERNEDPPEGEQPSRDTADITESASATIRELDEELEQTKDHLRSTIESYETRTEELRSSNEELLAMNEELESTAEELETREQELQAMNEELTTVNSELEQKVEELEEAYSDLKNFIAATHVAAIFLDRELCVRRFTPGTGDLFRLGAEDVGRPITDISHHLEDDRLREDLRAVLGSGQDIEREVTGHNGRWYVMQIRPYRTVRDTIDGVALSFFDITERKKTERKLERINAELEDRVAARTRALEEANEKLKEEIAARERLEQEVLEVSEEERRRIGESLHEDAGQTLTGVMLLLDDQIRRMKEVEFEGIDEIRKIRNLIEEVDGRLLNMARGIIPLQLGSGDNLSRALANLTGEMQRRYQISCRAEISDDFSVETNEEATHVYRIVQEAIQNAALHGEASEVIVTLTGEEGSRVFAITDNGSGPDGDIGQMGTKGMGLRLMQYRCRLLQGDFLVEEPDVGGMRVVCRFPADE